MHPAIRKFEATRKKSMEKLGRNKELKKLSLKFIEKSFYDGYLYNFNWLGRPIIQLPQDIVAIQEIIWSVKPDLIIETGIAHGGSLILSASILELVGNGGKVIGVDIDIRKHNRAEIRKHKLFKKITLIEGSSIDEAVARRVKALARGKKKIMVFLDSNHTHAHVARELELYSPLVAKGSYLVVFDTVVEDLPAKTVIGKAWGRGDNPKTAVKEFLRAHKNFVVDKDMDSKLLITAAPGGFLKRIR
jgi:cephalosporin hydroxylase